MNITRICLAYALLASLAGGCKKETSASSASGTAKVTLQLNWKPEAEFGGFYAAQESGAFKGHGFDVQINIGGSGAPAIQMVGAGTADFGIASADEVILARARNNGINVVAIFAAYQTDPHGIMVHASRGLKSIAEVFSNPGTVALEQGNPYAPYLKHLYGFDKVKLVPTPYGDLSKFRLEKDFAQQVFVTSEPIAAKAAGLDAQTFLVADTGYNPYATVVVTSEAYLKAHPENVKAFAAACREGWEAYQHDPSKTNAAINKLNPSMTMEVLAESAKLQDPLIRSKELGTRPLGSMTRERWETLGRQLVEAGEIDKAPPVDQCFVDVETLK